MKWCRFTHVFLIEVEIFIRTPTLCFNFFIFLVLNVCSEQFPTFTIFRNITLNQYILQLSSVRTILILKMGRFSKRRITNQDKMCLEAWTNLRVTQVIIYQINVCAIFAEILNNIIFWKIKWLILFNAFVKPFLKHGSLTFKVTSTMGLILAPVRQTKRGAEILHFAKKVLFDKISNGFFNHCVLCVLPNNLILKHEYNEWFRMNLFEHAKSQFII